MYFKSTDNANLRMSEYESEYSSFSCFICSKDRQTHYLQRFNRRRSFDLSRVTTKWMEHKKGENSLIKI